MSSTATSNIAGSDAASHDTSVSTGDKKCDLLYYLASGWNRGSYVKISVNGTVINSKTTTAETASAVISGTVNDVAAGSTVRIQVSAAGGTSSRMRAWSIWAIYK